MIEMVLGFLFDETGDYIALIRKNKPDWHRGLFNGVGGKIEEGETPQQAMIRECYEETGVAIEHWKQFAIIQGDDFKVYCFRAFSDKVHEAKTTTDEEVLVFNLIYDNHTLPNICVSNTLWLARMALDINDNFDCQITYHD